MKNTWMVLGLLAAACSTREDPSDLQYDPTVQTALAQAKKLPYVPCGSIFSLEPRFVDDSQSSPDNPRYAPANVEGRWHVSWCKVHDPTGNFADCQKDLAFTKEGGGHIFTDDGIAFLVGGLNVVDQETYPTALILQRVHVENSGCVEDHIRQLWVWVNPMDFTDPACAPGGGRNCNDAVIFDVVVGSTCKSVGAWTCTAGVLTPAP